MSQLVLVIPKYSCQFFFSSRRRHTRLVSDWSSDVCSSDLHRMLDNYEFLLRKREEFANEPIIPPPLVRGDDLIAFGLKPGPKFGEILEAVETRQLEGTLRTREAALDWVKREYLSGKSN